MDNNYEERNKTQIIRIDARNCFVESKSDAFEIGKIHLEFATYDTSKPAGQRQTNNVNIYIDVPEFLCLAQEALIGMLHARARQQRTNNIEDSLYESLGGTSADRLTQRGNPRSDGKSLSRIFKIILGKKEDSYLFIADSGPGETNSTGLIVPKFGNTPENHVAVSMSWRSVNELMIMTKVNYEAWLAAKYMAEFNVNYKTPLNPQKNPVQQETPPNNSGNQYSNTDIIPNREDITMF